MGEAQWARFQGEFWKVLFSTPKLNLGRQERKGFGRGDLREDGALASGASARMGCDWIRGTGCDERIASHSTDKRDRTKGRVR